MSNRYKIISMKDVHNAQAVSSNEEVYSTCAINTMLDIKLGASVAASTYATIANLNAISASEQITADFFKVSTSADITPSAGTISWNAEENTFDCGVTGGVTLQLGQEFTIFGRNTTSANIVNGMGVAITSAVGTNGVIHFEIASKVSSNAYNTIAVATQDIPIGSFGYVTKYGKVHDLNTSLIPKGRKIYLGTNGALSSANAVFPDHSVELGYCISSHPTSGIIYVSVEQNAAVEDLYNVNIVNPTMGDSFIYENNRWINRNFGAITKESTGFKSPELVEITYNETNRTILLTGPVEAYWRSNLVPQLSAGYVSTSHPSGVSATQYLSYDGSNIVWSSTPWTFDSLQIAAVVYGPNGEYISTIRESHGTMQWQVHREFHDTIGCYLGSGGDISSYVLASTTSADRRPNISSAIINDEDLQTTNAALTTKTYTRFSLSGASTMNFTSASTDIVALNVQVPFYNQFNGSTWVQTAFPNNNYGAIFVFAMPSALDVKSQANRFVFIQPQQVSSSLTTIQSLTTNNINLNGLIALNPEIIFIGKIIIRMAASNFTLISVEKLIGTKVSQASVAGNYLSTVTTDITLSGDGTSSSPLGIIKVPQITIENMISGTNTFLGESTGINNTSGVNNTFIGYQVGTSNTSGSSNTFMGYQVGKNNTTGSNNTFNGWWAGRRNTTGSYNTFNGFDAGQNNTTGSNNTFLGTLAGYINSVGYNNTFNGYYAGQNNTSGYGNTYIGAYAGNQNLIGNYNNCLGYQAGYNTSGNNNIFVGYKTGYNQVSADNKLIIDSWTGRVSATGEETNSLIVGQAALDVSAQTLRFNANTTINGSVIANSGIDCYGDIRLRNNITMLNQAGTNWNSVIARNPNGYADILAYTVSVLNSGYFAYNSAGTYCSTAFVDIGKGGYKGLAIHAGTKRYNLMTEGTRFGLYEEPANRWIWVSDSYGNTSFDGDINPGTDNSKTCGSSGYRWASVWSANGTIQTSDITKKYDIIESPLGLSFIMALDPIAYKFIVGGNRVDKVSKGFAKTLVKTEDDGTEVYEDVEQFEDVITPTKGKRQHFGFPAQSIKKLVDDLGIDFGGHVQFENKDGEIEHALRYDEFIAPMVKAMQEQQKMIEALNTRIEMLENKLR